MDILNEMQMQVAQLNMWTQAYDEGHPIVSDETWDEAYFRLKEFENKTGIQLVNSPTQSISYEVVSQLNKVKHNHSMLSLDKTKDWNEFEHYFIGHDVIGMLKLDGLTCSLCYENGELISAETRGNGEIGEDILHNAKVIKSIPKVIDYKEKLILDGEIICTTENFKQFSDEYANPRNFAAGSIRLLDSKECAKRNLTFVVWNVVEGYGEKTVLGKLNHAQYADGFTVVPFTSSFDWDAKEFLIDKAKELGYPIDGLVGRFDDIEYGKSLGVTGHHAKAAYAFKFYDEEYETELIDIEWSMGRTGQITPIAIFKSLDIDGSSISKASLSNISIMKETLGEKPFIGQKIYVSKRNMIIPKIEKAKDEYGKWIQ